MRDVIPIIDAPNIGDYYRIAGAIISRYHPLIEMQSATVEMAQAMLVKARTRNELQARVEAEDLKRRNGQWVLIDENDIPKFSRLTLDYN